MTVEEMAEEYLKELAKLKIPFSLSAVNESIKQAFKDGFIQGQENCVHTDNTEVILNLQKENEELKAIITDEIIENALINYIESFTLGFIPQSEEYLKYIAELKKKTEELLSGIRKLKTSLV